MNTTVIAAGRLTELAGRHGPPWGDGPPPFAPVIGALVMCLLLILLLALAAFLMFKAFGRRPPWAKWAKGGGRPGPQEPPETDARRVLADRFARGDISVDEFLERASVLNWTPGTGSGSGDGK